MANAYTQSFTINLGLTGVAQNLSTKFIDTNGVQVGRVWDDNIIELGNGNYLITRFDVPSNFRGCLQVMRQINTMKEVVGAIPLNPENAWLNDASLIEDKVDFLGAIRIMLAALAGNLQGAATSVITIRNAGDGTKTRIQATVDPAGNRTQTHLNPNK